MITYGRVWLNPMEAFLDLQTKNMRFIAGVNKIEIFFQPLINFKFIPHKPRSQLDQSVCLLGYRGWGDRRFGVRFLAREKISVFTETSRRTVGVNPASYSRGTRLSLHGRQDDHSHPSSVEVKNEWSSTYISGMFLYCCI
jgi:hypothetical protein